jgi:hypothetical protein
VALLKRLVPTAVLVALDRLCQPLGGLALVSPSVFVRCEAQAGEGAFPHCTACGSTALKGAEIRLACDNCGAGSPLRDGIYDFRKPEAADGAMANGAARLHGLGLSRLWASCVQSDGAYVFNAIEH